MVVLVKGQAGHLAHTSTHLLCLLHGAWGCSPVSRGQGHLSCHGNTQKQPGVWRFFFTQSKAAACRKASPAVLADLQPTVPTCSAQVTISSLGQKASAKQQVFDHVWDGLVRWQERAPGPSASLLHCSNLLAELLLGQLSPALPCS